jgi:hypothetical protein
MNSKHSCSDTVFQPSYSLSCKHMHAQTCEHHAKHNTKTACALPNPSVPRADFPHRPAPHLLLAARVAGPQGRQRRQTQGPPTGHQAAHHAVQRAPQHLARAAQR